MDERENTGPMSLKARAAQMPNPGVSERVLADLVEAARVAALESPTERAVAMEA